jgi:hypothetical protein
VVPIAFAASRVYSAVMRYFLVGLLVMFLLTGCVTDSEDRSFYYGGWLQPEKAADKRFERH